MSLKEAIEKFVQEGDELICENYTISLSLANYHPGVTIEESKKEIPWELKIAVDLSETLSPSDEELAVIKRFNPMISLGDAGLQISLLKLKESLPAKRRQYIDSLKEFLF